MKRSKLTDADALMLGEILKRNSWSDILWELLITAEEYQDDILRENEATLDQIDASHDLIDALESAMNAAQEGEL